MRIIVFTDLDGTLLDHHSYLWAAAAPALAELRQRRIPLIFCTSKTRTEVQSLRREMGNQDPFIVENGGAIIVPQGYRPRLLPSKRWPGKSWVMIGSPYHEVIQELRKLARAAGVSVRGFHQMTPTQVAQVTGLSSRDARFAYRREFDEPFVIQNESPARVQALRRAAKRRGLQLQRGGRFWHISRGCDKGMAVRMLVELYAKAWAEKVRTIALGDSANDLSMLREADTAVLIPKPNGSYDRVVARALPHSVRAHEAGPVGWNQAVRQILRTRAAA
jgi:mannosyl-3-phosphoglycerate phosphatase